MLMPNSAQLPLFVVAALTLLLIPGPSVLYILTRSVDQGRLAGFISVLGIQTGTLFHVAGAALGLSAILLSSALAFSIVKYLGAAYLIYLGVRKLLSREEIRPDETTVEKASYRRIYSQGVIVNVLNPKTALFFFAFLPQFVDTDRGAVAPQMLFLGIVFTLMALCTDGMYAFLAGTLGNRLKSSLRFWRAQKYFAGSVYIGLGLTTALSGSHRK
jgi:threonine/homoserine/homoserine lactone efflux protein